MMTYLRHQPINVEGVLSIYIALGAPQDLIPERREVTVWVDNLLAFPIHVVVGAICQRSHEMQQENNTRVGVTLT